MVFPPRDFKSLASAYSATTAYNSYKTSNLVFHKSFRQESNLQPADYKSATLPIVLQKHILSVWGGGERNRTFDLAVTPETALPLSHNPQKPKKDGSLTRCLFYNQYSFITNGGCILRRILQLIHPLPNLMDDTPLPTTK